MRSTFKLLFYINRNKVKSDGTTAVLCRISIDGKKSAVTTGVYCKPGDWDSKKCEIKTARENNRLAAFRRREDPQLFHRRLETSSVRNAAAILLLYLGLTFAGAAVISTAEELPLGACLYETASAAGTVGLTLGLTPQLGTLSQSILILLMFFGRVGGLTLIYAAFSGHDLTYARYPQEKITVG